MDDWFEFIHPLIPLLHRRRVLSRIQDGEMNHNPIFLALVISVVAVTSSSLGQRNSPQDDMKTPLRCAQLIEENDLLKSEICTVDWCIAHYNIAYALVGHLRLPNWKIFRSVKHCMAGVQWFLFYNTGEKTPYDEEISKRLYSLLTIWDLCVTNPLFFPDSCPSPLLTWPTEALISWARLASLSTLPTSHMCIFGRGV